VHDVIKHFIFPYFFHVLFQTARLKCNVTSFLVHDVIKHFIFPYFFPALF
jgi:hypothetical protein